MKLLTPYSYIYRVYYRWGVDRKRLVVQSHWRLALSCPLSLPTLVSRWTSRGLTTSANHNARTSKSWPTLAVTSHTQCLVREVRPLPRCYWSRSAAARSSHLPWRPWPITRHPRRRARHQLETADGLVSIVYNNNNNNNNSNNKLI